MKTRIVLLTRSHHEDELKTWLHWHLDVIGFSHAEVYDNESTIDVKSICESFGDRVTYMYIHGWPDQYKLYTYDLMKHSSDGYQWSIALDDDEYLYISDKYDGKIESLITCLNNTYNNNMYYVLWLNMFSRDPLHIWEKPSIYTHTYYSYEACHAIYNKWVQGNHFGKTLLNIDDYKYDYRKGSRGHIPLCLNNRMSNKCMTVNGDLVLHADLARELFNSEDEEHSAFGFNNDCFIAHYQFRSEADWKKKCNTQRPGSFLYSIRDKVNVYDYLYKHADSFKECTLLKDRLENFT